MILAFKVQDNSKFICLTFVYYITCIRLHDSCTTVDWLEWFKLNRTLFNVKLRTEERFYFSFYNNVQAFCVMLLKMHRNNCYCYNIKLKDRTRKPSYLFGCFSFWLKILNTHGRWRTQEFNNIYTRGYQKVRRPMRWNQDLLSYAYKFCRR